MVGGCIRIYPGMGSVKSPIFFYKKLLTFYWSYGIIKTVKRDNERRAINKMLVALTILLIAFASVVAITITHESLPLNKIPRWLDNVYYFVWDNLEKIFLR